MSGIIIRRATRDDLHRLIAFTARGVRAQPFGDVFPPAPSTLAELGDALLERGVIFIAEDRDARWRGLIGVIKIVHPFSGEPYGECVGWWVDPAARRGLASADSSAGASLLEHAERWAADEGLLGLKVAAPLTSRLLRTLGRRGYRVAEAALFRPFRPPRRRD